MESWIVFNLDQINISDSEDRIIRKSITPMTMCDQTINVKHNISMIISIFVVGKSFIPDRMMSRNSRLVRNEFGLECKIHLRIYTSLHFTLSHQFHWLTIWNYHSTGRIWHPRNSSWLRLIHMIEIRNSFHEILRYTIHWSSLDVIFSKIIKSTSFTSVLICAAILI